MTRRCGHLRVETLSLLSNDKVLMFDNKRASKCSEHSRATNAIAAAPEP